MKTKILYVERKPSAAVSIEKVFRQIAKSLSRDKFSTGFQSLNFPNGLLGTLKNLLLFRKNQADIYHITGHVHYISLIFPKAQTVLTIHDLGILRIRSGLRKYVLKKLLIDLPVKKLEFITAVSEFTKAEIVFHTSCEPQKIRVIENPLQDHFFVESKKRKFDKQCPVILQIGTTANKNLENLIRALENINCRLKIIGELNAEIKKLLAAKKIEYENKSGLNDAEIFNEYEESDIVSFCSTFEGFGLPVIEAQAMRTPILTSNISPLKEVAGNFAAFADPHDCSSIQGGLLRIINDDEYRNELINKGLENVKRFNSQKIAAEYENLYCEIIKSASLKKI